MPIAPIASLPWYDLPSTRKHLDSVYEIFRQNLVQSGWNNVPDCLNRVTPIAEQWINRSLILSQCCGPDLISPGGSALRVIARPVFHWLDCAPGDYFSYIVATTHTVSKSPNVVVNSTTSYSGCVALLNWLAKTNRYVGRSLVSGSHQNSIEHLRAGVADVAAIDAYSWRFLDHDKLVVVGQGESAPAPPFVTHVDCTIDRQVLVQALKTAYAMKGRELGLVELVSADYQHYQLERINNLVQFDNPDDELVARPRACS